MFYKTTKFLFIAIHCFFTTSIFGGLFSKRKLTVGDVEYSACSDNLIDVYDVNVTTDDVAMYVTGRMVLMVVLDTPVKAKVLMHKKVLGAWVRLPCVKEFGSCTHEDLCDLGVSSEEYTNGKCPADYEKRGTPCRCPIEMGNYTLPMARFELQTTRFARILSGKYRAQVVITKMNNMLACYKACFRVHSVR